MKKILFLILGILLLVSVHTLAFADVDARERHCGDYVYVVLADGTAEISSWKGNESYVEVPSTLDGYKVSRIGDNAFFQCDEVYCIVLPEGVSSIGASAFGCCFSLESIILPDSIRDIASNPFGDCWVLSEFYVTPDHPYLATIDGVLFSKPDRRLLCYPQSIEAEEYTVPQGIRIVGEKAFVGSKLSSIILPNSVIEIEADAFRGSNNLSSITLSDSLESIGDRAFSMCDSLMTIAFPDSIRSMGENVFEDTLGLQEFVVSPNHEYLATIDGVLFSKPDRRLICFPRARHDTSYSVPNGIQQIGDQGLYFMLFAKSIDLPDSLKSIGSYGLASCTELTSLKLPDGIENIGDHAFTSCISLESIRIPEGITALRTATFSMCYKLKSVSLPSTLTTIDASAFASCQELESIAIPESVESLGNYVFAGCTSLKSVNLPERISNIGEDVFSDCNDITVTVARDSYAAKYCKNNGVHYTYPDSNDWLNIQDEPTTIHTTFTASSGNIGTATVNLKKGFDFIETPSAYYNKELALIAVTLSAQVYNSAHGKRADEVLFLLGYDDADFSNNGSTFATPGVCFAYKRINDGTNLFVVIVRGTDNGTDIWTDVQDGALSMFRVSGDYIKIELEKYMREVTGKTKAELLQDENYFFFTGHSLGGAVANYLSINGDIMEYADSRDNIYTYTFESPHTCVNLWWMNPESESNAYNFKVDGDAVTNLPPYIGATTYGKDVWIRVSELDDSLFNTLFPDAKIHTLATATSVEGHGDIYGLHDTCLGLVYIMQNN